MRRGSCDGAWSCEFVLPTNFCTTLACCCWLLQAKLSIFKLAMLLSMAKIERFLEPVYSLLRRCALC